METKRIQIQGLQRNKALNEYPDGAMQEIINMRFRDGSWRPIPGKEKIANALTDLFDKIWLHTGDNLRNYIGYNKSDSKLSLIDISTGESTTIKNYFAGYDIEVKFLKRLMIVVGDSTDVFLWKDGKYENIDMNEVPYLYLVATDVKVEASEKSSRDKDLAVDTFLGNYRKVKYDRSNDGYIMGAVSYRFAWKLWDGSFVKHTIPKVLLPSIQDHTILREGFKGKDDDRYWFKDLCSYKINAKFPPVSHYNNLSSDIYVSLCVFLSAPAEKYRIDEETFDYKKLQDNIPLGSTGKKLSQLEIPKTENYDKLADPSSWYLVHEIPLEQLQNLTSEYDKEIDLKGYLKDYAVRQTLSVDSFSHHKIGGRVGFVYNDRFLLGHTRTTFGGPTFGNLPYSFILTNPVGYSLVETRPGYLCAVLKTDEGEKRVFQPNSFKIYTKDGNYYIFVLGDYWTMQIQQSNLVIGYQDARAAKMEIYIDNLSGGYSLFGSKALAKSKYGNYAYYNNDDYTAISFEATSINSTPVAIDPSNVIEDENRVQISELRNPFVFPAKYSYQVGTGRIIGMGANTEPLSTGQYGQYPLIVFTTKGLFAMEQGQGDVLFAAISPVSGDVPLNQDQIISVGAGVTFTTKRGIYLVVGKQVTPLSDVVEGLPLLDFQDNKHFQKFITDSQLCTLITNLSILDVLDYIPGSKFGFDKINNELIISNETQEYSYVFNFDTSSWHKTTDTFNVFINDYPELLGLNSNGLFNLSNEPENTPVQFLFVTQPQNIEQPDVFKKMERSVLRCNVVVADSTYLTYAIFASDDLKTWQFITGGQRTNDIRNILVTRSHGSAKYYIFVICGQLLLFKNDTKVNNSIQAMDITIAPRLYRKLRK